MNLQPTIFISSIISEFYDLRGALKYFLGKSGFGVLMSEEPDFGADCDKNSLDNCKGRIESSDYYLLIIGTRPGYEFQLDNETNTRLYTKLYKFRRKSNIKNKDCRINLTALTFLNKFAFWKG